MQKYHEIYISSILQAQSGKGDRWPTPYFRFELLSPVGDDFCGYAKARYPLKQ